MTMEEADPLAGMDPVDPPVMDLVEATAAAAVIVMMRMNGDTEESDATTPSNYNPLKDSTHQAEHPSRNGFSRPTFGSKLQESGTKIGSLKPSYYWKDMHSPGG